MKKKIQLKKFGAIFVQTRFNMKTLFTLFCLLFSQFLIAQTDTTVSTDWKVYNPGNDTATYTPETGATTTTQPSAYTTDSVYFAQNTPGEALLHKDARLDSVSLFLATKNNPEPATMEGYRVQIFITQNKAEANKTIKEFRKEHETIPVYRVWIQPNHPVRAGDCRNKLEAQKLLEILKFEFPGAYIVRDEIQLPAIESYVVPSTKTD